MVKTVSMYEQVSVGVVLAIITVYGSRRWYYDVTNNIFPVELAQLIGDVVAAAVQFPLSAAR